MRESEAELSGCAESHQHDIFQVHVRRSHQALEEGRHDAGGHDVAGAAHVPREDVERIEAMWKVQLVAGIADRHGVQDVAHDQVVDRLGQGHVIHDVVCFLALHR